MARLIPNERARLEYKQRMFLGLIGRPLRVECEHCHQIVLSNTRWECGRCGNENERTRVYSFLNRCRSCRQPPKSYECPHCARINFLDEDRNSSTAARTIRRIEEPAPLAEPLEDPRAAKRRMHEEQKEDVLREIEMAQLNARLAEVKAASEPPAKKNSRELLEESYSEHDTHSMAIHTIAREQRLKNAERFKDDPELLEMANESLQAWVENQLIR